MRHKTLVILFSAVVSLFIAAGRETFAQNSTVLVNTNSLQTTTWGQIKASSLTLGGVTMTNASRVVFAATSSKTVSNTVTETTIVSSSGVGSITLPANTLQSGSVLKIKLAGIISNGASDNSIRVKVKFGGTTILDSTALTASSIDNLSDVLVNGDILITCRSASSSGSVIAGGKLTITDPATILDIAALPLVGTSAITVNTTISSAIDITWQYGTARSTDFVTIQQMVLEL